MKGRTRKLVKFLTAILVIYLSGAVILFFIQDQLLFHPTPLPKDHQFSFEQEFEEINIAVNDRNLNIIKFKTGKQIRGVVLFFHGNRYNVEHYQQYPLLFTSKGFECWMIDYPGFGKTTGKRTESSIYQDALLMYEHYQNQDKGGKLFIYGKSIGTGAASYLASAKDCDALILETPYYSIDALAKHYFPIYPVMPLTRYSFPNYRHLKKIDEPVYIFHGRKDEIIPFKHSEKLKKENPSVHLVTIDEGKHNDLAGFSLFQKELSNILDATTPGVQ